MPLTVDAAIAVELLLSAEEPGCRTAELAWFRAAGAAIPEPTRRQVAERWGPAVGGARAISAPVGGSCFGTQLAHSWESEHFVVEYEDGIDPGTAEDLAGWLEVALQAQTGMGWREPVGLSSWRVPVYIYDRDLGGAATSSRSCGELELPLMVVGRDALVDPVAAADMAAHELNHALQLAYSEAPELWFWEATATWIEEYVQPTNGWSGWVPFYSLAPELSMVGADRRETKTFLHMYGLCVWAFELDEAFGGPDVVRQLWEAAAGSEAAKHASGQAELLAAVGLDFDVVYADWLARLTVMAFREHELFMPVSEVVEPVAVPSVSSPSEERRVEAWGQSFLRVADPPEAVTLRFTGDLGPEWLVLAVVTQGAQVDRTVVVVDRGDVGEALVEGLAPGELLWVVSSPRVEGESGPFSWTLEVEEAELPDEEVPPETPDPCGCRQGGAGLLSGFGALLLLRRRRS